MSLLTVPAEEQAIALMKSFLPDFTVVGSYVDGRIREGRGEEISLYEARNGELMHIYHDASPEVVAEASAAAAIAQAQWIRLPCAARGRVVHTVGQTIRERARVLAELECITSGKPLRDCLGEVQKVAEMFEYYAGWADKIYGDVIPVPSGHLNYTLREPLGVVLQITPWNAPIFTCGWQVAPAIATGNGVLLKPSEITPWSSIAVAALAEAAGVPRGLVNVLAGNGHTTGAAAIRSPVVKKVVFVGSPSTGALIAQQAAQRLLPCVLELGGKSANIVFDDADFDRACMGAQAAIFSSAGQSCVAGSRLLVQRSMMDRFVQAVAQGADRLKVGDPTDPSTEVGPIIHRKQFDHVRSCVKAGLESGAIEVTRRAKEALPGNGYYVSPTLLSNASNDMAIAQAEIFGPVLTAIPFDDENHAVALANESAFGLAGAVWTRDVSRAHRVAAAVRAGTFWINSYKVINVASPFGGSEQSGYGRSSGTDALREYTQPKSVWVETSSQPAVSFGYAPA